MNILGLFLVRNLKFVLNRGNQATIDSLLVSEKKIILSLFGSIKPRNHGTIGLTYWFLFERNVGQQ